MPREQRSETEAIALLLESAMTGKLVALVGAGLSHTAPSNLPSASELAARTKREQVLLGSSELNGLHDDLEQVAEHYFSENRLATYFIPRLIGRQTLHGPPNAGHEALGDFLLVALVESIGTTNVDCLIEGGAKRLHVAGVPTALDTVELTRVTQPGDARPLLKLHGCWERDPENTLWCTGQLERDGPLKERLGRTASQLGVRWSGHNLLVAGFWTDWAYLNALLLKAVEHVRPELVVVVDTAPVEQLKEKAPDLWRWVETQRWCLIQGCASDFLDRLRKRFSGSALARMLSVGEAEYESIVGQGVPVPQLRTEDLDNYSLYELRRDAEGKPFGTGATVAAPDARFSAVGATHLRLLARGASVDGGLYLMGHKRIRVVAAHAGEILSSTKRRFLAELPSRDGCDFVIAVGARRDGNAAVDVVRPEGQASITRPRSEAEWLTIEDAEEKSII